MLRSLTVISMRSPGDRSSADAVTAASSPEIASPLLWREPARARGRRPPGPRQGKVKQVLVDAKRVRLSGQRSVRLGPRPLSARARLTKSLRIVTSLLPCGETCGAEAPGTPA